MNLYTYQLYTFNIFSEDEQIFLSLAVLSGYHTFHLDKVQI